MLHGGEVAAAVELDPVHDVVALLGVAADGVVLGEDRHPHRHGHRLRGHEGGVQFSYYRRAEEPAVPVSQYSQQDLIASNLMGRALSSPHFEAERPNLARFIFLDPRAKDYYADWPLARSMTAAMLRLEAGRDPLNSDLTALIGELSTLSPQFRNDWAEQDVHEHRTGRKVYRHPEVGEIEITFDVFELPGEPGLSICTYSAEEGSGSADKFALLASWAATQEFAGRHGASLAHGQEPADSAPPTTKSH